MNETRAIPACLATKGATSIGSGRLCYLLLLFVLSSAVLRADLPPLIPRSLLLGNPERWGPKLSSDGKQVAWIAPDTNNVLQVWVRNLGEGGERVVTADRKRGVRQFFWAKNNRTLLYAQDSDGDENFHIFGVDLQSGNVRDYTPFQGVRVDIMDREDDLSLNRDFPETVLAVAQLAQPGVLRCLSIKPPEWGVGTRHRKSG